MLTRVSIALCVIMALPSAPAMAVEADQRAVDACKRQSDNFVQISRCLPEAHVAVRVLGAFDEIYDEAARPVKSKCLERNADSIAGAYACVIEAVKAANRLRSALPEGEALDDAVFSAVADQQRFDRLMAVRDAARLDFPDQRVWGAVTYSPYE